MEPVDPLVKHRALFDARMRRGVEVSLWLLALAGMAQALATWFGGDTAGPPGARLAVISALSLGFSVLTLIAQWVLRRRGVAASAMLFSHAALALLLALPWLTGKGLADASLPALVVVVLCLGLMVSPASAWRALWVALFGLLVLAVAQGAGQVQDIDPTRPTPVPVLLLGHAIPLLLGGWLVLHYTRVFWISLHSLESSRRLLADSLAQQQAATERLQAVEERQRCLLDASLTSILIFDGRNAELLLANPRALGAYGVERLEELQLDWVWPGQGYGRREALALFARTLSQGPQYQWWRSQRRDGGGIWWDIKTVALALDGREAVVVFGHDISDQIAARAALSQSREQLESQVRARTRELQAQQQHTAAIIEALPLTLSIRDRMGRYLQVNRQFERSSGWTREQLLGRTSRDFLPPSDAAQIDRVDAEVLALGSVQHYEQTLSHPQDGARELLFSSVPMQSAAGGDVDVLTLGTDISSLKLLQRELEHARDEAQHLARAKSDFLANMSHEIRTPLNAVLGLAELAQQRADLEAPVRQAFERIHGAGEHLLGVVNDILDFAKLEAAKFEPELRPADAAELARAALALLERKAQDKGLRLALELAPELPRQVLLDVQRVNQVLVNLLGNALKFTSQGGVTLSLGADAQWLRFAVRDSGPGIDPWEHERIFNAFEQADSSATRRHGGTGLGLSISRQLARLMGGDIELQSRPGEGACFTLRLPCRRSELAAAPGAATPAAPKGPLGGSLAGLRVLMVDDVALNREILAEMLGSLGAEVHQADSGPAALARFAEIGRSAVDLVLMDVQMPGMDGYETTRRLHALHPDLPVIALTAHALPEQRAASRAAGMCEHITKPVQLGVLQAALREQAERLGLYLPPPTDADAPADAGVGAGAGPAGMNYAAALSRCAGKPELLRRLLGGFVEQYLDAQLPADGSLRSWAHRLKGTAGNLGLEALSASAARLEAQAQGDPAEAAAQDLQRQLRIQLDALQSWLGQDAATCNQKLQS